MSENLLDKLAQIREMQGREPIDGSRISGLGPELPPPEWTPPTQTEPPWHEDPDEEYSGTHEGSFPLPKPEKEVSPLVRAALPEKPQPLPQIPMPDLAVLDSLASYQGHDVKLNDSEKRQIAGIVLRALQRVVREQLDSLIKLTPKRARRARTGPKKEVVDIVMDPIMTPVPAPGLKKRRGRPRGSLLK